MSSISLTLGLRGRLLSGTQVTLQGTLFGNNEPGFTFEPWDITTLYQDRAGTTPVTAAGQSVGLRLSKDQGLRIGPELVTNGDNEVAVATAPLDTLTNFTAKVRSADFAQAGTYSVKLTANSTSGSHYWNLTNVAAGVTVKISGWVYVPTGATAGQAIKLVDIFDGSFVPEIVPNAGKYDQWVYFSAIRPAKATAWALSLGQDTAANWAGGSIYVDGLSIKTLAGNHEVAVSDAKRGVYGWMPKTGRRNQLTYTEQFDNAVWLTSGISPFGSGSVANSAVAPNGSLTADFIREDTTTGAHYVRCTGTAIGQNATFSVYVKAAGRDYAYVYSAANTASGLDCRVNLTTGAVTNSTAGATVTTEDAGNGWWRVKMAMNGSYSGGVAFFAVVGPATGAGSGTPSYTGDGSSGIYVWGTQAESGSTATAYQRVVSQYDITEAGVPTCYYVQADGVDDAYVTPTITPNTDKVQVFAGVRNQNASTVAALIEHSTSTATNNGAFIVAARESLANYFFASKGTISGEARSAASYAAPVNNVLTALADISGDTSTLRVNGTQVAQSTADQGTGNFLAYPVYIYARAGTSLPFNGLDFGHAVRFGPNLDAATIARVESLIARNTPEVDFLFGGVWTDQYNWDDETNWNDGV